MTKPAPFRIRASDDQLQDLRSRLHNTRWPESEVVDDWSQGTPLSYVQEVATYWADQYDWRSREAALNRLTQWRGEAEGFGLHFVHMRSPHENALPLLLSHGWPGSIVEFAKAIPSLLDPVAYGGSAEDAFHVVAPSLPGFAFSDKPEKTGMDVHRIATLFDSLMRGLGYDRYVAQGGDWGSVITTCIGAQNLGACAAIHVNMPIAGPTADEKNNPDPDAQTGLDSSKAYQDWDSGYSKQQSTRPQTVGYGLADSPAGQAAWILEKFWRWTDCNGHPENALTRDEMLDNIMLYWLTNTATSSARLYWESFGKPFLDETGPVMLPTGCSLFPMEILRPPRKWAERTYANITYWNKLEKGGHFAAFEQPATFVNELRIFFREFR
tara:strand:- start:1954 stop:3099 length:1146 start_codon:yes stop_codon:yes gene_type:complete